MRLMRPMLSEAALIWGPLSKSLSAAKISRAAIVACLLLNGASMSVAVTKAMHSRVFNGVIADFKIKSPIIRIGEDLKVDVAYQNTKDRIVAFRFSHLDEDIELYSKGSQKPIIGGFVGEAPYAEVRLKPGESFRFVDTINMKGWPDLPPGEYEVRFAYHLGLLSDDALIKRYQAIYPHNHYVVPWSERRYGFRLVK